MDLLRSLLKFHLLKDDVDGEEDRDADSLTIKPPQAIVIHGRERDAHAFSGNGGRHGKEKISTKEKKHSKERRHKERTIVKDRDRERERDREFRGGDRERREYSSVGGSAAGGGVGGGGGGSSERRREDRNSEMERYQARNNYERNSSGTAADDGHDVRRPYSRHFDGNAQRSNHHYYRQNYHQQYHHMQHMQQRQQQHHHHDFYYDRNVTYHHHHHHSGGGGGGGGMDYHDNRQYSKHPYSGHEESSDRERDRDRDRDRERRKYAPNEQQQHNKDAESLEQDLRSRLLSKRHKYVRVGDGEGDGDGDVDGGEADDDHYADVVEYDKMKYMMGSKSHHRTVSRREKRNDGDSGSYDISVIEVLDSPDITVEKILYKSRRRHKHRNSDASPTSTAAGAGFGGGAGVIAETIDVGATTSSSEKRKTNDDPELLARKARFLAAEREKEQRKESAREELQARREILRGRERNEHNTGGSGGGNNANALSPSAVAASVTAGLNVIKRKLKDDDNDRHHHHHHHHHRKRKRNSNKKSTSSSTAAGVPNDNENAMNNASSASGQSEDNESDGSVSEDDDSDSHSDSGAAVSVKSVSPTSAPVTSITTTTTATKQQRTRKTKRNTQRRSSTASENGSNPSNDDNESIGGSSDERNHYDKTKSKWKSKNRKDKKPNIAASDGLVDYSNRPEAGELSEDDEEEEESGESQSESEESEDSFYAKRKREKHLVEGEKNDKDNESSPNGGHEKNYYRSSGSKVIKASRKTKKKIMSEGGGRKDEIIASDSPASEGSIKAQRVRNNNKISSGDEESESGSGSEGTEMESDDSYYAKKQKQRHHHHHRRTDGNDDKTKKTQRKSGGDGIGDGNRSSRSMSGSTGSDPSDDDFENGMNSDDSNSGEKADDKVEKRRWKERHNNKAADKFVVEINEDDDDEMFGGTEQSKTKIHHREKQITITDELETVYDEKGIPLPNYFPGLQGCRTVEEFQCLNRIEEGTYGVVYRARDQRTNEIVALKRLKMEKERDGFPITSLREINTLLKGQHPNIVTVREIVVGSNMDKIFIVMDYVEHDLKSLMETMKNRKQIFFPGEVKCLTQQLLRAVSHLHDNWILHRDLKTSNLLLSHKGILKVGDFGLAREYGSPLRKYTSLVVTRWYRAPELLLCSPMYSTPIDIWSVGCIFAEFLLMTPYLQGKSDCDQLNRIFKELGTPNEKIWPGYNELPAVKNVLSQNTQFADYPMSNLRKRFADKVSDLGMALLQGLLTYDPKQRLTAEAALDHGYFKELPLPIDPAMFPTWPAKSEMNASRKTAHSPKPPSGGAQFKQLGQDDITISVGKSISGNTNQSGSTTKVVSGIITGNKKSASNTGFVLNAGIDQRQLAMGPGFNLKF